MSNASKRLRARLEDRAGTRIDFDNAVPMLYLAQGGVEQCHGFYDPLLKVYQGGGDRDEIFYLKGEGQPMSLMVDIWRRLITYGCERWEMIDHRPNIVYSIPFAKAKALAYAYKTSLGRRMGVPKRYVDVVDANGRWIYRGDPIPPPPKLVFGEVDPRRYVAPPPRRRR